MATATAPTTAPQTSAKKLLVDWANRQDSWVRQLVSEVLSARAECTDEVLDAVFEQYLIEKGLAKGDAVKVGDLELDEETAGTTAEFQLVKLSDVVGVNALATDQEIDFNPALTVLFGENAAGKTGYTRILKQLAAVRTAEPILPNVHDSTAPREQKAVVEYSTGGAPATLEWDGQRGVSPFTHMGIFDASCVRLHIDEDLAYVYTPSDLSLFPYVTAGITAIRVRLDESAKQQQPDPNPYLHQFTRDTQVYAVIETLGAATDISELRSLATVPADSKAEVERLEERVSALQTQAVDAALAVARSRQGLHARLADAARTVAAFRPTEYAKAVEEADQAEREYAALRRDVYPAGAGTEDEEAWEQFVLSGEAYREHLEKHEYPTDGDTCLYCDQPLEPDARRLLQRYREFATDTTRERVRAANERADTEAGPVTGIDVESLLASVRDLQQTDTADDALTSATAMLELLSKVQGELSARKTVSWDEVSGLAEGVQTKSDARSAAAEELIGNLSSKDADRAAALDEARVQLADLKDRVHLASRLKDIEHHVAAAKWVERARSLSNRFTPLLRSLTESAKTASEGLLNSDFATRFQEETAALRAPKVKLEFPGREGKAARRKMVSASHRPSAVLSEGEQKVIALADFLAEASLRLTAAPIVFDDPVTSLDYRRIREVADRVAALAADRQVIVFTHNIWFTTELLARFEKARDRCTYYSVTDHPAKGVVTKGVHPRWDTVKKTRGRINSAIQNAKKHEGEDREAFVEQAYSHIRTWCEVAVEEEILAGVTRRFEPNVMMTALPKIKGDRIEKVTSVVLPVFEKACRIMEGHSQPLETLGVRPSVEELEEDWTALQEALEQYQASPGLPVQS
jgi:hypothetical protein